MTKTFKVEKNGKQSWVAVRQMPHDTQYAVGSRIPGLGRVVELARIASEYGNEEIRWPDGLQHYGGKAKKLEAESDMERDLRG